MMGELTIYSGMVYIVVFFSRQKGQTRMIFVRGVLTCASPI